MKRKWVSGKRAERNDDAAGPYRNGPSVQRETPQKKSKVTAHLNQLSPTQTPIMTSKFN